MLKKLAKVTMKAIRSIFNMLILTIGFGGWGWFIYDPSDFSMDYWDYEEFLLALILVPCMVKTLGLISRTITKEVIRDKE